MHHSIAFTMFLFHDLIISLEKIFVLDKAQISKFSVMIIYVITFFALSSGSQHANIPPTFMLETSGKCKKKKKTILNETTVLPFQLSKKKKKI